MQASFSEYSVSSPPSPMTSTIPFASSEAVRMELLSLCSEASRTVTRSTTTSMVWVLFRASVTVRGPSRRTILPSIRAATNPLRKYLASSAR